MHVKFNQNHTPYVKGDVAPFEAEVVKQYIKLEIAEETEIVEPVKEVEITPKETEIVEPALEEVVTNVTNKPRKGKAKTSDK
jgi:hypothetical protein